MIDWNLFNIKLSITAARRDKPEKNKWIPTGLGSAAYFVRSFHFIIQKLESYVVCTFGECHCLDKSQTLNSNNRC